MIWPVSMVSQFRLTEVIGRGGIGRTIIHLVYLNPSLERGPINQEPLESKIGDEEEEDRQDSLETTLEIGEDESGFEATLLPSKDLGLKSSQIEPQIMRS